MENREIHLVKKVSKELGLTYKELGERIGYAEANLKRSVSTNKISKPLETAIKLYLKTIELQKEIDNTKYFKKSLKDFLKD